MKVSLKSSAAALVAAMLFSVPISAATLNIGGPGNGGLLGVGGSNTDPRVDVLTNSGPSAGSPFGTITTNAPNDGTGPTTAAVNLGGLGSAGDANGTVLLDLFGAPEGSNAAVALGAGNGTDDVAAPDFFGNAIQGNGSGGSSSGSGSGNDLFGPAAGGGNGPAVGGVRVASLDSLRAGQCFAPDAAQIARLVNRHSYLRATLSNWVAGSSISMVRTNLCKSAQSFIVHDANVAQLEAFVRSNPTLRSFLAAQGRSAGDVIAIDKKGDTLTIYVS